ncbi:MAG: 2,3,4,5-tetrahydropyridine-2,6-dicarboxylate N-succinyltransferase, partial [Deltaproteobacteria bacterium]
THAWVKQAIMLYFRIAPLRSWQSGPAAYCDRIPLKQNPQAQGIRVVPPGAVRYGAHLQPGCVLMPGYVNIGAFVGHHSMVDTFATVGSCAQIGAEVHLSGGVGIGGVLEPAQATPVIVEDGAFIGSRCIVVEGVRIGRRSVLGAGVVLTASTPILDVTGETERVYRGTVPPESVVIPGQRERRFAAGAYSIPCALIVGKRSAQTDLKTSLNEALRRFDVQV